MRPIIFHLADGAMVEGLKAFFRRSDWHYAIGCSRVEIDPNSEQDFFKVPGRNDQGVWQNAHDYLAPFLNLYKHAVIIVDEYFDPWPGAEQIYHQITTNLINAGWDEKRFQVVVIQPMLEAWLWMKNDNVARAFGVPDYATLRDSLINEGLWEAGQAKPKPSELKNACHYACRMGGSKSSRTTFANIFNSVSSRALDYCTEPGFIQLRERLREWFPRGLEVWE